MLSPLARSLSVSLACALAAVSLALPLALADELDGRAIAEKADKHNRPKDEKDGVTMVIVSARGEKRKREMTTWFKAGEGDDDKLLVRFDSPSDVKGTGLLTIEQGPSDEQWLYLPDLRKSKKIAGSSKASSFMGTDFSNYDMRTEDLQGHDYAKKGEEEVDGRACYAVEVTPKTDEVKDTTGYARRTIWVDKERFTINKCEYFDKTGKPLKTLTTEGWKQVEGLWRPTKVVMENKQEGSKTIVTYERGREINKGVDDTTFTKRKLEAP